MRQNKYMHACTEYKLVCISKCDVMLTRKAVYVKKILENVLFFA